VLKLLACGAWACAVTLLSGYATLVWSVGEPGLAAAHDQGFAGLEFKKTKPINVPMIAEGEVQGYVVAQFVFTADAATLRKLAVPPDIFLLDEAFRALYADEKLDFRHLEKYDITKLTKNLPAKVNERLGVALVKDVLVQEFNYVSKDEMKR